ncbi:hypothetical protein NDU88_004426 [Pleurodeles waltl]|uniref:Uncharacterized protein n=1 Tax=Pleurodeles waltl TaxID=8319 RepID=A0AAV7WVV0_PLEWA|nr:hypothetical protein NDU88_004426 [Pleurodeles waltl]
MWCTHAGGLDHALAAGGNLGGRAPGESPDEVRGPCLGGLSSRRQQRCGRRCLTPKMAPGVHLHETFLRQACHEHV